MSVDRSAEDLEIETLDYDSLYRDYQKGLVDTLRGFGPSQDYLSLWVPSEDPHQGIWNLFDAVSACELSQMRLQVGPDTRGQLDMDRLLEELDCFGNVRYIGDEKRGVLEADSVCRPEVVCRSNQVVQRLARGRSSSWSLSDWKAPTDIYQQKISEMLDNPRFLRSVPDTVESGIDRVEVELDGALLWLAIKKENAQIVDCGYNLSKNPSAMGGLEAFCRECIGRPLREGLEHGVLRTEFRLRPSRDVRAVPGIVLCENADPLFLWLKEIVTKLRVSCSVYIKRWKGELNEYDQEPGQIWRNRSPQGRMDEIEKVLARFRESHAQEILELVCVELQFLLRVVVEFEIRGNADLRASLTLELERELRDTIDPRLELFLQERRDKNKIRRLSVISTPMNTGPEVSSDNAKV